MLISAFIANGSPRSLIRRCTNGEFTLLTSRMILDEYVNVIHRSKFSKVRQDLLAGLQILASVSQTVEPSHVPRVVPGDPDDDVILATAIHGSADVIVTGDRHLLDLREHHGILLLGPKEFLFLYGKAGPS